MSSLPGRLDAFPRVPLATYPTQLEHLETLSRRLGQDVYVKRDDQLGPAPGGNKARKLEYLIGDAVERGAKKVVTFGGVQSNHCRMTAGVAAKLGLEAHIFCFERRPRPLRGNPLISALLGAKTHFLPFGGRSSAAMTLETANRLVRQLARPIVGRHYFIPVGGHSWRGCLGYVRAALELDEQAGELGLEGATVVTAAGTGGTLAGLMAGFHLGDSSLRPLAVDVGALWKSFPRSIASVATELCAHLDDPHLFDPADVPLVEKAYVGDGYAIPSVRGNAAIRTMAQSEGIVLDPVYTGKAFAGLWDLVSSDQLAGPVIFLHTGGLPALFAFDDGQLA